MHLSNKDLKYWHNIADQAEDRSNIYSDYADWEEDTGKAYHYREIASRWGNVADNIDDIITRIKQAPERTPNGS